MKTELINKEMLAEEIATPDTDSLYGDQFCGVDCDYYNSDLGTCYLFDRVLEEVLKSSIHYRCQLCKDCFKEVRNER